VIVNFDSIEEIEMMLLCEPNRAAHLLASLARQTFTIVWYDEPPILLIQMMLDDLKKLLLTSRALLMLKKKDQVWTAPARKQGVLRGYISLALEGF
jgi:hypothetical protein